MNKLLTAIALSIALPAVANAQAAPQPKADCCEKMKADGKDCACCKDMAKMDHSKHDMKTGANPHAGHDMSQSGANAPQADAQPNSPQ